MPRMPAADRQRAEAFLAGLPPAHRSRMEQAAVTLGDEAWAAAAAAPEGVVLDTASSGLQSAANNTFESWLVTQGEEGASADNNSLIVTSVWGVEKSLYNFLGDASARDKAGSEIRTAITELEEMLADWPDDGSTQLFSYNEIVVGADGSVSMIEHKNVPLTKEQAQELLSELNTRLDSLSVFTNRDEMMLQMMVHKYQQVTNAISNILKNTDETRRGIISNVKA
jgi:hypothetical protein